MHGETRTLIIDGNVDGNNRLGGEKAAQEGGNPLWEDHKVEREENEWRGKGIKAASRRKRKGGELKKEKLTGEEKREKSGGGGKEEKREKV